MLTLLPVPIKVTEHVWHEVADSPTKPGVEALVRARDKGLLQIVNEGDSHAFPQLDEGESTVLSAAASAHAGVLVDERKARRLLLADESLRRQISWVSGLLGLLLFAKRRGLVTQVQPLLDQLIAQRFYISPTLRNQILRHAGELTTDK